MPSTALRERPAWKALESATEPELSHDSSTNALVRHNYTPTN